MLLNRRELLQNTLGLGAALSQGGLIFAEARLRDSDYYLSNNFAPVQAEMNLPDLEVSGTIPRQLRGSYLRNGPNPAYPTEPYHWFDGDGMIHALSFADGKVSYANRFIATEGYLREKLAGKSLYGGMKKGPPFKDVANTSLIEHHGKILALWEGGEPYAIDQQLRTKGPYTFDKQWTLPVTAHPKIDPKTGELLLFAYRIMEKPYLTYGAVDAHGRVTRKVPIDLPYPVMIHDFVVTENYAIFMILPFVFTPQMKFAYMPKLGARIAVLPRGGAARDVRWFTMSPCWVFHYFNAYEDGARIVIQGHRYESFDLNITAVQPAYMHEWSLDLVRGRVQEQRLAEEACEFPIINRSRTTQAQRYGYSTLFGTEMFSGLIKYDFQERRLQKTLYGSSIFSGEAMFIPDPEGSEEDAGWLVTFAYDKARRRSLALLYDARQIEQPIARIQIPLRVPYGFHSLWVPEADAQDDSRAMGMGALENSSV